MFSKSPPGEQLARVPASKPLDYTRRILLWPTKEAVKGMLPEITREAASLGTSSSAEHMEAADRHNSQLQRQQPQLHGSRMSTVFSSVFTWHRQGTSFTPVTSVVCAGACCNGGYAKMRAAPGCKQTPNSRQQPSAAVHSTSRSPPHVQGPEWLSNDTNGRAR
jgi:hypothetical protein